MSAEHTTPQESTPIFPPGRRLALVIGTNGQPAPARAPLHYAVNDAIDMAHVLQQKYCGFELVCPPLLGAQASSDQIRAAVIELARQLQKDDLALFFFSGHAEALPTGADLDEVYLVSNTFDAGDIAIDCDAHISLRWLRQVLFEHKKAGSVLLFLAGESRAALSESFPEVLQKIAERGGQEIIFVDGLDQLQPDQQTGLRDLSFLPQGPGNPPPGIVFVLGTRPNDTLRPLALLKPHRQYSLPAMSREDFDAILRRRHVTLERDLTDRFYEALEHNALYLDLVAQELAARPHADRRSPGQATWTGTRGMATVQAG